MSELNDRFETLAGRGARRGAPAVIAAAARDAAAASTDGGGDGGEWSARSGLAGGIAPVTAGEATDDALPVVAMEELRRTRSPYRTVLAAAGMAALLGVGTLAISALDSGGADSPEDALRQLADAVSDEDLLAAVDVLAPDEVGSLHRTVDEATRRAAELELVGDAAAPLQGVDLRVDDLDVRSEELAPGFAKVTVVGGSVAGEVRGDALSEVVRELGVEDVQERVELSDLRTDDGVDPFVMAIEHDGGWYVSPAYTVLEYIRTLHDLPVADLGSGRAAASQLGADSPDAAVQEAAEALAAGDWQRVVELVPPDEVPLYDYREALAQLWAGSELGFTIDDLTTSAEVDGDTARVAVRASGASRDDPSRTWKLDEQCLRFTEGEQGPDLGGICGLVNHVRSVAYPGLGDDDGLGVLRATAVRRDGRWFVSPVESVLDVLRTEIADLDDQTMFLMLGLDQRLAATGTLTLGEEVTGEAAAGPAVYAFEGRAGQEVVGAYDALLADRWGEQPAVRMFEPGGAELEGWGVFMGRPVRLPVDGTYRISLRTWTPGEFRFTLYDAAAAPDDVLDPPDPCADPADPCGPAPDPIYHADDAAGTHCFVWPDASETCALIGEELSGVDPLTGGTCTASGDGAWGCSWPGGAFGNDGDGGSWEEVESIYPCDLVMGDEQVGESAQCATAPTTAVAEPESDG